MIRLSINLPTKRRLDLHLVKKRKDLDNTPLLPNLGEIRRTRNGNKISRYFRHIFEQKRIKRLLGINLAMFAIVTSFFPAPNGYSEGANENIVAKAPIVLTTERAVPLSG